MSDPKNYTVGWICAITVEYVAAQLFLDEEHEGPQHLPQNDYNNYKLGKMGSHNVVIAVLPDGEYGTSSAARVAADMHHSFPNVRIGLIVGIGGGAPNKENKIHLGDVVVSSPRNGLGGILSYDSGKAIQDQAFQMSKFLNQPPTYLRTAVQGLRTQYEIRGNQLETAINSVLNKNPKLRKYRRPDPSTDRLYRSDVLHPIGNTSKCADVCENDPLNLVSRLIRTEDEDNPMVHYGIIASANTLIKDAMVRDELAKEKGVLCFEMESAGLINHFPCLVIRGICDYADTHKNDDWHGYAAMTAAAYAKDLLRQIPPNKVEAERRIDSQLDKIDEKLDAMNQRAILDKLPVAREAAFNSIPEAQESTCLAGTRVDILHRISEWANDFNTKPIFWLSGMAGTGKSTISRTIAQSFAGHLGASFFFKRGDADRGTASKIFTTIAADLLIREPALAPYIKQAIDNDPAVPWKGLQEQFDQLISQPLLKFVADGGKFDSVIIIIDALDECERESQIKSIIGLLSHLKIREGLCLRTFVTSRPELPVRLGFHAIEHKNLILHEIPQIIIKQDISLFLEYKIAEIREKFNASVSKDRQLPLGWPGESSFQSLVNMAVPLFIFAATVSRFIADRRGGDPDEKLKDILLYESRSQESRLDATYMPVLSNIISGLSTREREKTTQQFQNIIGSVITLASPLSSLALSQILNVSKRIIDNQLDLLHSVLRVPSSPESPIRLLHISFRDFLTDPDKEGRSPFWIDEKQAHARMAINCLNVMGKHLKCCICGIRDLGMPRSEIQPAKIEACLPPEAQYACLYWTYHLRKAEKYINANEKIYNFLICHFLHWIEALSLMGRTHESLGLINELLPIRDPISNLELVYFLNDAIRFIRRNITAIEETPLQLYSSLLVFAPRDSVIKNTFKGHISWIAREPETEMEIWNQHLQTLEGHSDGIKAVVFSHNSSLLASASHDGTVRIWNTNTGECLQELQVDTTAVQSVIFLEGSTRVASVSKNMTICIHEVETGRCIQQLKGYHKIHQAAIAVYNSTLLVSAASNDMVRIWDINAKKCLQVLRSHSKDVFSLAISTDLKLLVSMSNDKTAFIWDIDSKKPMKRFQANGAMAFSRDSKYIVAGCIDNSVGVWPVIHGNILHKFKGHTGQITAVTFSDDSKLVASASVDRTVKIWHVEQGVCIQEMQNYSRWVSSITFSHDSAILALASDDSTVRIWNIEGNQEIEESPDQWGPVMSIVPSPDSTLVASLHSAERAVRMWHVDDGECMDEIVSHDWVDSANFSLDSAFIATRSVDQTAHIWRTDSGECVYEFLSCSAWLESVSFSHDSTLVASASIDGCVVQILNVKEHKQIQTLHGHTGMIRSITFSHDSALMLTASEDKTARIWHIESGLCLQELQGHTCEITFAVFSYDSALATSTSSDKLRIWDVQSGSCLQEFPGHANDPKIAAFSHDSALLAVSYQDNTVRIWQIHTGNCLLEIDLGATTTRLSFSTSLSLLATDVGAINLQYLTQQSSHKDEHYSAICGYGISKDRSWITWNGKNTLWLPPEYRPSCSTVLGSTVMFGTYSGSVISFRFPDDPES